MAAQRAIAEIGNPPRDAIERNRLRELFLEHANALIDAEAPIRASIDKARTSR